MTPAYPASDSPKDQAAAEFAELWANKMFLEPAVLGHYPQKLVEILERDGVLWEQTPAELQLLKEQTVDVLGVNFYHPFRVKAQPFRQLAYSLGCQIFTLMSMRCLVE